MAFQNQIEKLSQLIADSITGAVIHGGQMIATAIQSVTITASDIYGSLFSTASGPTDNSAHWELSGGSTAETLVGKTGSAIETSPAGITVKVPTSPSDTIELDVTSGVASGARSAELVLQSNGQLQEAYAYLYGDVAELQSITPGGGAQVFVSGSQAQILGPAAVILDTPNLTNGQQYNSIQHIDVAGASGWGMDSRPNVLTVLWGLFVIAKIEAHNAALLSFSSTSGGIGDQLVCTIPSQWAPGTTRRFAALWNGRGCFCRVDAVGHVYIEAVDGYGTGPSYPASSPFYLDALWIAGGIV